VSYVESKIKEVINQLENLKSERDSDRNRVAKLKTHFDSLMAEFNVSNYDELTSHHKKHTNEEREKAEEV